MSEAIAVTEYPAWQQAIRQAQSEQQVIDARTEAEQQAKQDAETAAEIAEWTTKFNRVLGYLGLPEVATGRIAVVDEIEFALDGFNTHSSDDDWYFDVGIRPAVYPETEAELKDDYDYGFSWYHHLPNVTVSTGGWRSSVNENTQRRLRAVAATGIDTMTKAFELAKAEHLRWQEQQKERIARMADMPVRKAPTLEEKLKSVLRELIDEALEERQNY